ncbi:MAG TPA: YbaB/EbfC family nucleoid-associated protein [Candidatus Omnitrophota bacterium]|nr:YbaB/EbfC family nucleoid-associated protein [Candidatus Omnitrophota bacterium]
MFDKMKQLMDLQKQMQQMKRELDNTYFDVTSSDNTLTITMNGSQEVRDVVLQRAPQELDKAKLENAIKDAYNRGIKKSQTVAAEKMKGMTGLNVPGLL